MKDALLNAFKHGIEDCLAETNNIKVEIFDCYDCIPGEQRSFIKTDENEPVHFTLNNLHQANLTFAALDNCILKAHQQSRCDFIIGNFHKLYFVEIKQVNRGQRRLARTGATQQLHSSIAILKEKINLNDTEVIAVICLKAKQVHPLQSAKRVADIVAFRAYYNAELTEGQMHDF